MYEKAGHGLQRDSENSAGPSKASTFLSKAKPILFGAAILGGLAAVAVRYDGLINEDLVNVLKENWSWARLLSSGHAMTALSQMYPGAIEGLSALLGGLLAAGSIIKPLTLAGTRGGHL